MESGSIRIARGPRAVEALLLDELVALAEEGRADPSLLASPVLVVVQSRSLRQHLCAALLRRCARPVLGLVVQTLHTLALEIVERAGAQVPGGDELFAVVVREHARREDPLRARLDGLVDGYALVAETVTDLFDAGFEAHTVEALEDALVGDGRGGASVERALSLVRTASRSLAAMGEEIGHRAFLLRRARELLVAEPDLRLPARAVWVHGFADATGVRAELIESLVRHRGARVLLDEPPHPADPAQPDPGRRFTARLRDRLEGIAPVALAPEDSPPRAQLVAIEAPGAHAEVRAVTEQIRGDLDAGVPAERIGVVARDLAAYRAPLRAHFERLGVPFSGVGEPAPSGPLARRVRALLDLLQEGPRVGVDRWLDACAPGPAHAVADLRLGLRRLGIVRLEDLAGHRVAPRDLRLPATRGWSAEAEDGGAPRSEARRLARGDLAKAVSRARALAARLAGWPRRGTCAEHLDTLGGVLDEALGWQRGGDGLIERLEGLRAELPGDFALSSDDFPLLLRNALGRLEAEPLGGRGGGVQVLNVMEARARTFERLFVLGLNRDVFPRSVREDPLLPDFLRRRMLAALPDLPVKGLGHDEERYLFAQLCAASPRVTLCWQSESDDGRALAPSTLVERLRWGGVKLECVRAPRLPLRRSSRDDPSLVTPWEHALAAGLRSSRRGFGELLSVALSAARAALPEGSPCGDAGAVARGRLAVLRELDPDARTERTLGPYFGFVGPVSAVDPRGAPPFVSVVENAARCPWQAFVLRLLHVLPPPDPREALPGTNPRLVGMAVHTVLDRVARSAFEDPPDSLAEAAARRPVVVPWPDAETLDAWLGDAARSVLEEEGVALHGLARVLADQARPLVARARELDWPDAGAGPAVLGSEIEGEMALRDAAGAPRTIRFRADRVDRSDGGLLLTDYKTGRPISIAARADTRAQHFLNEVAQGAQLQAVVYAHAEGAASGRLLFLRPDLDSDAAAVRVAGDDADFAEAGERSLRVVLRAWDQGSFVPRLVDTGLDREPALCERCEVAEACLRGDTGARRRLVHWVAAAPRRGRRLGEAERALLAVWNLPAGGEAP